LDFGDVIFNLENVSIFSQFAIPAPKNEHCDEINNAIVNRYVAKARKNVFKFKQRRKTDHFLFPT